MRTLLFLAAISSFCAPSFALYAKQVPLGGPGHSNGSLPTKRIGIVGLGAGGISYIRALGVLPKHMRENWDIVAFDERHSVGGLWVPDDHPPPPPGLPATPLYPHLRTNGPHPFITLPNTPLPPNSPLLAPRATVLEYWQGAFNSASLNHTQILLKHSVTSAKWIGSPQTGFWRVRARDMERNTTKFFAFDHLLVAPGVNRFPRTITFPGQDSWVAAGKLVTHCMWYRGPNDFMGKTVLVLGGGPSGFDMARLLIESESTRKVYWSRSSGGLPFKVPPGVVEVPRLLNLHDGIATLVNGTALPEVDHILLATGYDTRVPFLTSGGFLDELDTDQQPTDRLSTNSRYIHPLFEHTIALDSRYPVGALYFNSILLYNPTGTTNFAQALFAAYTIADPSLLATREALLAAMKKREQLVLNEAGIAASRYGHRVDQGYGQLQGFQADGPFQDLLVHKLRDNGFAGYPGIPEVGFNYTETWRLYLMLKSFDVLEGWHVGLKELGDEWETEFIKGQRSEADYLDTTRRLVEWWTAYKKRRDE